MQGCSVREMAARFSDVLRAAPGPGLVATTASAAGAEDESDPNSTGLPHHCMNVPTLTRIPCPGMVPLPPPTPPPPAPPSKATSTSSASLSASSSSSSVAGAEDDPAAPPGQHAFRATQVWSELLATLRGHVDARRRRVQLRYHDDCFTGADVVDVLITHLARTPRFNASCELSRIQVTRLCQSFVDCGELEPVGSARRFGFFGEKRAPTFEDGSSSFYRFPLEGGGVARSAVGSKEAEDRAEDSCLMSNRTAVESSDQALEKMFSSVNLLGPSLPATADNAPERGCLLSKKAVAEVWRHQTLLRLLQLIDLTVLDSVLESPPSSPKRGKKRPPAPSPAPPPPTDDDDDLVVHNPYLELTDAGLGLPVLDEWLAAALDCLDHLPDALVVEVTQRLPRGWGGAHGGPAGAAGHPAEGDGGAAAKRVLFEVVGRHYGQAKRPLLENRLFDVHTAILELILKDSTAVALEATQLCLRLLEASVREELRALLRLMHVAALASSYRLHKQADNLAVVRRTFGKAIVQNKALSKSHAELLISFMMDNHAEIFKVPVSLHVMVSERLSSLQEGGDPNRPPGFTYCVRQSRAEYAAEGASATEEALRQLVASVSEDTAHSAKHKRRLLKELQRHHPQAFSQHFSTML
ncbi:unnamed protein product [Lampetra planeri]